MPGLHIPRQKVGMKRVILWFIVVLLLIASGVTAWWAWQYYNTGAKPPIVLPVDIPLGNPDVDETPISDKQKTEHTVPVDEPRYISIPGLSISNVRVFGVGLTSEGAVDAPKNIYDAAWYNKSAKPGDGYGVVLIDAHNGGASNLGIFAGLSKLAVGEKVVLERGDGEILSYTIVENKTVSLEEANKTGMKRIMQPYDPNKEGLGLITCAGVYVPKDGLYNERVLVRAVLDDTVE